MKNSINWKWVQFILPLLIWFLLLGMPFLRRDENNYFFNSLPAGIQHKILIDQMIYNFILLSIFYIHTYAIYPLLNKKTAWYIGALIALLGTYCLYWTYLRQNPFEGMPMRQWRRPISDTLNAFGPRGQAPKFSNQIADTVNHIRSFEPRKGNEPFGPRRGNQYWFLLSPMVAILLSVCYRIIFDNRAKQQLLKERETAHLKSELTFLRSQISPHFIFNVLNNLVALARKKSDSLEPAIVSLSQLMRYMLYESDDSRVTLGKELEYIKSYISLQMLRFRDAVKTNINVDGNVDFYAIEPMLLIPFVENAFKHGTGTLETAMIDISLSVNETTRLMHFNVTNDVGPADDSKDSSSGIGIANVRRRLAILYPDKHELTISNTPDKFMVDLTIYLTE
ncbi:sensor histidine kinase [Mucilaginibacter sp. HD30]